MSGQIIDDEYAPFVLINGSNVRFDAAEPRAVIFDTRNPTGGDFDLAAPFDSLDPRLADGFNPGNVLIIQERNDCDFQAGFCQTADDEGTGTPGDLYGEFEFIFAEDVTLDSIDFFDVETDENSQNPNSEIHLYGIDGSEIQPGTWFVPDTGGDNLWSQLEFGEVKGVRRMVIEMAGSGAIDNIVYSYNDTPSPVPLPASAWLFGSALGLLGWARRRWTMQSDVIIE